MEYKLFFISTVATLVLGHSMLAVHRFVQGHFSVKACQEEETSYAAWKGLFPHASIKVQSMVGVSGAFLIFLALVFFLASWFLPLVSIEMNGVVGVFLDVTGQTRKTTFSIADLCARLAFFDLLWVAMLLTWFVGVMPLLCTLSLALLWILPLSRRKQALLLTVSQSLNAWSSIDCFALAMFVAVVGGTRYGISRFTDMVIYGGTVAPACNALRDSVGLKCLDVRLVFAPTSFVLFAAVAMLVASWTIVFRAVHNLEGKVVQTTSNVA
jgi:hypothetical protein